MNFDELLNEYINKIDCTSKELAEKSTLSNSTISRYRSGERVPTPDFNSESCVIKLLSAGLVNLAAEKEVDFPSKDTVIASLLSSLENKDFSITADKINRLIDSLKINASNLANALSYDPSYISRVRSNKRQPYDIPAFIKKLSQYVVEHYKSDSDKETVAVLMGVPVMQIRDNTAYFNKLSEWLSSDVASTVAYTQDPSSFLKKFDEFNLEDYIESIHFNDIKVPTLPFYFGSNKNYYGLKEMGEGELDFFKATVLSKSMEDVTMCNDMPIEDLSQTPDYPKKWMFGLAVMLKKGLRINMIHNLNRPFNELMIGLEGWIPLYMTGQVTPYYLNEKPSEVYNHLHYTSGDYALCGESIVSHHEKGHYYLTKKKDEVAMYKDYNRYILDKALPLMQIFKEENLEKFADFLPSTQNCPKGIIHSYTSLPLYTLDSDELLSMLIKSNLSEHETDYMLQYHKALKESVEKILKKHTITDEIVLINKKNFKNKKPYLLLTEAFCSKEIRYTWEMYEAHLKKTEEFAKKFPNYTLIRTENNNFKNIQITIVRDKWALISKSNHPNIHFVIHHPVLRDAIENMLVSMRE